MSIIVISLVAMNLLLCYYALRDVDKLKRHFQRMILIETGTDYDDDRYYSTDVSPFIIDTLHYILMHVQYMQLVNTS